MLRSANNIRYKLPQNSLARNGHNGRLPNPEVHMVRLGGASLTQDRQDTRTPLVVAARRRVAEVVMVG